MERLTSGKPLTESQVMNSSLTDLYMRLKSYEDAEEQGRLIVLPCKVGDTVWQYDFYGNLYPSNVRWFVIDKRRGWVASTKGVDFDETAVGKTVFLTREEAEKALEG